MKKVVKSKVAAQKWLWWSDNGKIFNNNNSGEFVNWLLHGQNKGDVLQQFNADVLEAIQHSLPCNGV